MTHEVHYDTNEILNRILGNHLVVHVRKQRRHVYCVTWRANDQTSSDLARAQCSCNLTVHTKQQRLATRKAVLKC